MNKGLWVGTGIVIGLIVNAAVFWFAQPTTAAPAGAQQAEPQAAPDDGPKILATGGSKDNRNDICWILFKDGKSEIKKGAKTVSLDRYVLCCYRVAEQGKSFDIVDVREVTYDVKGVQLNLPNGHEPKFSPKAMRDAYLDSLPKE
jgi:hypothetical protein